MTGKVIVTVQLDGTVEVKAQGVSGPACKALTAPIEAALGLTTDDKKLPEYHHAAKQGQEASQQG
jgi:hypothetical protein